MKVSFSGADVLNALPNPAIVAAGGVIIYMNGAAERLARKESALCAGARVPEDFPEQGEAAGVVELGGERYQLRSQAQERAVLYLLTKEVQTCCLDSENAFLLSVGMKNTMNNMLFAMETLQDELAETELERSRETFSRLNRSYYRLLHTVDSLSLYSRLNAPEMMSLSSTEPVELKGLCLELFDELEYLIQRAGKTLTLHIEEGLPPVYVKGERHLLERMICQLCANGMHTGSELILSLSRRGASVVVAVTDNGEGISDEVLGRGFIASGVSEGAYAGKVGFGLPICRKIAQLHGGSFMVSRRPKGTAAVVSLPMMPAEQLGTLRSSGFKVSDGISLPLLELSGELPPICYDPAAFL